MNEHKHQIAIEEYRRMFWTSIYIEALKSGDTSPALTADVAMRAFDSRFAKQEPEPTEAT